MRIILSIFLLFLGLEIPAQSLAPKPDPNGTRFYFRNNSSLELNSVSVAGSFNNWKSGEFPFIFNTQQNYWSGVVKLETGKEYHYKFILNDTLWITDPNAPLVTEDEWQNGIISPIEYGRPYILDVSPANGQRITKLQDITLKLEGFQGEPLISTVKLSLNGKPLAFRMSGSFLRAEMAGEIPEGENDISISFSDSAGNESGTILSRFFLDRFTLPINSPEFYDSAIMYEIYIRKFADSDGDGIGDFRGLASRLGYLSDTLGVNTLWLMPWSESTTEHGYNVVDYFSIEKDYGTFADYLLFLKECKSRGIKVIMDFVINHTDSTHPYFLDAYSNPASVYTPWYQFTNAENSDWAHFGVERKMPKLDFTYKPVGDFFLEVAKFWLDPNGDGNFEDGIDGFRCDAAKEVPHKYWAEFRKYVKSINPQVLILGEVWDNINYLIPFYKNEFDMLFDYPLYYALQRYFNSNNTVNLITNLGKYEEVFPEGFQTVRFFSNHDNQRPLNYFDGKVKKMKQGLFLSFILPGTPMLYYGDELLYSGVMPPENVRNPFDWDQLTKDLSDESTMFHFYENLIKIRKSNPVLFKRHDAGSSSMVLKTDSGNNLLLVFRYSGEEIYLGIINNSDLDFQNIHVSDIDGIPLEIQKKYRLERIIGEEIQSDRFAGIIFPVLEKKDNYISLSNVYINKGGFILFKISRQ